MKKIVWHVVDHKGKRIYGHAGVPTRAMARDCKITLQQDMFEPWNDDIEFPVRIEREEWQLLNVKVVV